jgi:hypothetical protein
MISTIIWYLLPNPATYIGITLFISSLVLRKKNRDWQQFDKKDFWETDWRKRLQRRLAHPFTQMYSLVYAFAAFYAALQYSGTEYEYGRFWGVIIYTSLACIWLALTIAGIHASHHLRLEEEQKLKRLTAEMQIQAKTLHTSIETR